MELDQSNEKFNAREFSMDCFHIMERFHWTYDELMNLPLPVFYSLREYISKIPKK